MKKFILITVLAFSFNNLAVMAEEIDPVAPDAPVEVQLMMIDEPTTRGTEENQRSEDEVLYYTTGEEMQTTSVDDEVTTTSDDVTTTSEDIKTTSEEDKTLNKEIYETTALDEKDDEEDNLIYYAGGAAFAGIAGLGIYSFKKNKENEK